MTRTARVAALLALGSIACRRPWGPPVFDYGTSIGLAVRTANRTCLEIRDATLSPGQRIRLVTTSTPPIIGEAEVAARVDGTCPAADGTEPGLHQ